MNHDANTSLRLKGIAASPGIAIGRAIIHSTSPSPLAPRVIPAGQIPSQLRLLAEALGAAERELLELQERVRGSIDEAHAGIFDSHIMFIRDPAFHEKAGERIRAERESAHYAVMTVIQEMAAQFSRMEDAYISSRATDVFDIGHRICKHLMEKKNGGGANKNRIKDAVIFARDMTPSETAQLDQKRAKAFATEIGGPTSHSAILAKALEIPAVVGLGAVMRRVRPGDPVIVDGYEGTVTLNPTEQDIRKARNRRRRHLIRERDFRKLRNLPAETIDGYQVELSANIEFPSEIPHVLEHGANGIGLFRTEFIYLERSVMPSEDEQYAVYREVLERVAPGAAIFRTLDVGGDKFFVEVRQREELNPFLGLRAIRFCLAHPEIFGTQLRALLRASAHGRARIMFPMVSSIHEVIEARKLLEAAKSELDRRGEPYDKDVEIGVMIEIPSAALTADELAEEVDFFSIGTNDLIQYTLAADRSNEKVAALYDPLHPAILRLIRRVIDAAHRAGIWVGVCGEMAASPKTALLLLGMGVDELSMGALAVPEVKYVIRNVRLREAQRLAAEIYGIATTRDIREVVDRGFMELLRRRIKAPVEAVKSKK